MAIAARRVLVDYYAALQVHPDADAEVIEAAYRQLMKKHHPDVAGDDPARVAAHHARSKTINEAFAVLRDPRKRREYDELRTGGFHRARGVRVTPPPSQRPQPTPQPTPADFAVVTAVRPEGWWLAPFRLVADAYYLLPGKYEWESGRRVEQLATVLLPVIGTTAFCLATGRLAPLIGHSLTTTLLAWVLLALGAIPLWQSLPRVAIAALPSAALVSGILTPFLSQVHAPMWLAWPLLGSVSLILAPRMYLFSVLPTVGVCWLISHLG